MLVGRRSAASEATLCRRAEICREIRAESGVPIVMLTAKGDTVDVVLGLEAGADDYVVKPFSPRELASRVAAVLGEA